MGANADVVFQIKSNQIKSNQIKSNQIKSTLFRQGGHVSYAIKSFTRFILFLQFDAFGSLIASF